MNHIVANTYWIPVLLALGASLYAVVAFASWHVSIARSRRSVVYAVPPAVSVLKPLCGDEPHLFDNLATFCEQDHAEFELIFGVAHAGDPAIGVVQRLQAAFAHVAMTLVVDGRIHGSNLKVSNLINLSTSARHDLLVLADSDIAVPRDYLARVCEPLADPQVGIVTCLYRARGIAGFWSRVGAQFVNSWFAPSVRVAHAMGSTGFGFGATLALSRQTLDAIGGFGALRNELADDYRLAESVRKLGMHTVLSSVVVQTDVSEHSLAHLWQRETRWMRTIRSINPVGFASLFITFTIPWLAFDAALLTASHDHFAWLAAAHVRAWVVPTAQASLWMNIAARGLLLLSQSASAGEFVRGVFMTPVRDCLLFAQWIWGCFGGYVSWRNQVVPVFTQDNTDDAKTLVLPD